MKAISLLLKLLVTLVLILVIALVSLFVIIDPNDYKPEIVEQVRAHTGRNLDIAGDIGLSVFPWVGVRLGEVALSNAEGFSDRPFASIQRLDVKVKLLPLLRQEVEVDTVRLHGLYASLEVNEQGTNNWQDLVQPPAVEEGQAAAVTGQPAAAEGSPLAALAINGIEVIDAQVHWQDAASGMESSLRDLDLQTSAIRFGEPVEVTFSTQLAHNQPALEADFALSAMVTVNRDLDRVSADDLRLTLDADAAGLLPEPLKLELAAGVIADLAAGTVMLASVRLDSSGVILHANAEVTALDSGPRINGEWRTEAFNGRRVAKNFGIELPPMQGPDRLENISLASTFEVTTDPAIEARLDDLDVTLDDSRLTGFVHVLDLQKPAVRYRLHLTAIDADAYLPPPTEQPAPSTGAAPGAAAAAPPDTEIILPELLRTLDLEGEMNMDEVIVAQLPITAIHIETTAKNGILHIDPVSMQLLQGTAGASATLDATTPKPSYAFTMQAGELNAGPVVNPILAGLKGDDEITLDGRLALEVDVKTQGVLLSELKQAAEGRVVFDMGRTILSGVDLEFFTRNVVADYLAAKQLNVPDEWRGTYQPDSKTAFDLVHASADIDDGKVSNRDMRLQGSRLQITGRGEFDIINNTMDYRTVIDIEPPRKQNTAEKLLDMPLPVAIRGPFSQPSVSVDHSKLKDGLGNLLEAEAKARLEEEKTRLEEKARQKEEELKRKLEQKKQEEQEQLENKLRDKLKGLF